VLWYVENFRGNILVFYYQATAFQLSNLIGDANRLFVILHNLKTKVPPWFAILMGSVVETVDAKIQTFFILAIVFQNFSFMFVFDCFVLRYIFVLY